MNFKFSFVFLFYFYGFIAKFETNKSLIKNCVAMILRIISWLICIYFTGHYGTNVKMMKDIKDGLADISNVVKVITLFSLLLTGNKVIREVKELEKRIEEKLDEDLKKKVLIRDLVLLLLWCAGISINCLLSIYYGATHDIPLNFEYISKSITWATHIHGWILAVLFLHTSLSYRIFLYEHTLKQRLTTENEERPLDSTEIVDMMKEVTEVIQLKEDLNSSLGVLLFLMFFHYVMVTLVIPYCAVNIVATI